jgi:hypothetical protein
VLSLQFMRLTLVRVLIGIAAVGLFPAARAAASTTQISILEDDPQMMYNTVPTLQRLRLLGVQEIRVPVRWSYIAPSVSSYKRPAHFNAVDPAAYPRKNWVIWDNIVKDAKAAGITVNFDVVGVAPLWATGRGAPGHGNWEPNAGQYGEFVHALATRYSGNYNPATKKLQPGNPNDLPRISSWSIWNEPDYGPSLAPQTLPNDQSVDHSPEMYRSLVDAGWNALHATGHGRDLIMFGELAPRGERNGGLFSGTTPLVFLRSLYCLDSSYRPLRGSAARLRGCPTNAAGTRAFRKANPALFDASGVSDHPYMRWYPPNREQNPDPANGLSTVNYTSLGVINQLPRALDRAQAVYGAHPKMPIYDTEFGYLTTPPKHDNQIEPGNRKYPWLSQAKASDYLNWAEYLSWSNPRLKSFMQFLLYDPLPATKKTDWGGFASGLINYGPRQIPKATYYAWRFPLYLPVTSSRRGRSLEVWGCARPARYAILDGSGPQTVAIQFAPGSSHSFKTVATATVSDPNNCYIDTHVAFSGSGNVRLQWQYPASDPLLGSFSPSQGTITSRTVQITLK